MNLKAFEPQRRRGRRGKSGTPVVPASAICFDPAHEALPIVVSSAPENGAPLDRGMPVSSRRTLRLRGEKFKTRTKFSLLIG